MSRAPEDDPEQKPGGPFRQNPPKLSCPATDMEGTQLSATAQGIRSLSCSYGIIVEGKPPILCNYNADGALEPETLGINTASPACPPRAVSGPTAESTPATTFSLTFSGAVSSSTPSAVITLQSSEYPSTTTGVDTPTILPQTTPPTVVPTTTTLDRSEGTVFTTSVVDANPNTNPANTSTESVPTSASAATSKSTGNITGKVIGSLCGVLGLLLIIYFLRRRYLRRRRRREEIQDIEAEPSLAGSGLSAVWPRTEPAQMSYAQGLPSTSHGALQGNKLDPVRGVAREKERELQFRYD
ncbi:hypothetical protein MKEN_00982200 [Mycena kentingensis (nom. inval.)]|nr:hypothetical protein MKEN_00982200 [Mycena kentingensis (nom. inval.)]